MNINAAKSPSHHHFANRIDFESLVEPTGTIKGSDFYVVCKLGGWIEVYDLNQQLISTEVFLNIKDLSADEFITVTLKNGWSEIYDKSFNMQSIKYFGD